MTIPNLQLVGDLETSSLDAVATLTSRVAELEAEVTRLCVAVEASEQAHADCATALRHVATLASSASLACSGRDPFAQAQLRALSFLATSALEMP